jgi:hypothetical protein
MAVLSIRWETAERISPVTAAVTPREGEEAAAPEAPVRAAATKPMWIYVTAAGSGGTTGEFDKIESVVLTDDKIAVGANAFRCIKMTPEAVEADPLLAEAGSEVPRFIFVSHDYQEVDVLEGRKISVSGTYAAMKGAAKASYTTNFDKNVRALVKLLNEFDKINNERGLLDAKAERLKDPTQADTRKIDQEREALAEREKAANEERDALLKFELRAA